MLADKQRKRMVHSLSDYRQGGDCTINLGSSATVIRISSRCLTLVSGVLEHPSSHTPSKVFRQGVKSGFFLLGDFPCSGLLFCLL